MRFALLALVAACTPIPTPTGGTGDWDLAHADPQHSYIYNYTFDANEHLLSDHCSDHKANQIYTYDAVYVGDQVVDVDYADPTRTYHEKTTLAGDRPVERHHVEDGAGWVETWSYDDSGTLRGDVTRFDNGNSDRVITYSAVDAQSLKAKTCIANACTSALFHGLVGEVLTHWDTVKVDSDGDGVDDLEYVRTYDAQSALATEVERDLSTGQPIYAESTVRNEVDALSSWSHSEPDGAGGTRTFTILYSYDTP